MKRQFQHLGTDWDVATTGTSSGAGFFGNALPPLTSHGVVFRSPWGEFHGTLHVADPENASVDELRQALDQELERRVLVAINGSRWTWRPAEAISNKDTHIPVDHVRRILETTTAADVILAPHLNQKGERLYTTKDHLARTTGDVVRRYFDVEETS